MYCGISKESGGVVGEGILLAKESGVDFADAAANTSAEESLVCLEEVEVDGEIEWREVVMTSYIDSTSGDVAWKRAADSAEVFRRTICTSQMTSMLRDRDRNNLYEQAIQKSIEHFTVKHGRPPVVLDIGAGTGLLSLFSARHGASAVVGCEMFQGATHSFVL